MSANKGYPSIELDTSLTAQDVYVTGEPIREKQHGLSVLAHTFVRSIATDAVEANSTTKIINATAHVAKKGDIINFTSGPLAGQEVKVRKVTTDSIILAETLAVAPNTTNTFQILRHKYPLVDSNGNLTIVSSTGPVQYESDGSPVSVSEDTVTPANTRGLPVRLVGAAGPINITAGDLNVSTSFATDSMDVSGSSVTISGSVAVTGPLTDAQLRATAVPVSGPLTDTQLRASSVPVSGPLTDAQLRAVAVPVSGTVNTGLTQPLTDTQLRATAVPVSGTFYPATQPVSATALPLPTGAATETTLAALNTKVTAVNTGAVVISSSALPTGAATETTVSAINTKIPASLTVTSNRLLVDNSRVVASTFVRNDYSSTNVTTGAYVQLIASTANTYKKLSIFDSSGQTLKIAIGGAGSEVDLLLVFPGGNGDIDVNIPSGSRISIRAVSANAAVGEISINLFV